MISVQSLSDADASRATIRPLARADAGAVRALFSDGQLSIAEGSPPEIRRAVERYAELSLTDDLADVWPHYMERTGSRFWLAEADGRTVGTVGVQPLRPGFAEVRRMAVARGHRRRGIAISLLHAAETWAKAQGYVAMEATTTHVQGAALALYESAGYRVYRTGAWGPLRLLHLRKHLREAPDAGACEKA